MLPYYFRRGISEKCPGELYPTHRYYLSLPTPSLLPLGISRASHLQTLLGVGEGIPEHPFCEAQHCSLTKTNIPCPKGQGLQHSVSKHWDFIGI